MADYYAVLKRTLAGFGEPKPELRVKLYDRARVTIVRQLEAANPPLSKETIKAQKADLEQAIAQVEAEYDIAPETATDPPPVPFAMPPDSEPVEEVAEKPETVSESAAAETTQKASPGTDAPGASRTAPPNNVAATTAPGVEEQQPVVEKGASDPLAEAFEKIASARETVEGIPKSPQMPTAIPMETVGEKGGFAGDGSSFHSEPAFGDDEAVALGVPPAEPVAGSRSMGGLIFLLLFLLIIGGAAGALWLNRGPFMEALNVDPKAFGPKVAAFLAPDEPEEKAAEGDSVTPKPVKTITIRPKPQNTEPAAAIEEKADGDLEQEKLDQRLNANGEEVPAAPLQQDVNALPTPETPTVVAQQRPVEEGQKVAPAEENETPQIEGSDSPGSQPAKEAQPEQPAAAEIPAKQEREVKEAQSAASEGAVAAVSQDAILYEEGDKPSSNAADTGRVVWSVIQESPGADLPPEPAIRARLEIPDRKILLTMTLKRNADKALPASHLIELNFAVPEDFSGGGVEQVNRFVVKNSEQDRGDALVAVSAKIADGIFLIALNNLPAEAAKNIKLLAEGEWFDIPVQYRTGRRALVTMEKGIPGDRVFKEVLAAWAKAT